MLKAFHSSEFPELSNLKEKMMWNSIPSLPQTLCWHFWPNYLVLLRAVKRAEFGYNLYPDRDPGSLQARWHAWGCQQHLGLGHFYCVTATENQLRVQQEQIGPRLSSSETSALEKGAHEHTLVAGLSSLIALVVLGCIVEITSRSYCLVFWLHWPDFAEAGKYDDLLQGVEATQVT